MLLTKALCYRPTAAQQLQQTKKWFTHILVLIYGQTDYAYYAIDQQRHISSATAATAKLNLYAAN